MMQNGGTKEEERKQKRRASNRRAAERYRQKQKASVDDFRTVRKLFHARASPGQKMWGVHPSPPRGDDPVSRFLSIRLSLSLCCYQISGKIKILRGYGGVRLSQQPRCNVMHA